MTKDEIKLLLKPLYQRLRNDSLNSAYNGSFQGGLEASSKQDLLDEVVKLLSKEYPVYRHVKRGTLYKVLFELEIQIATGRPIVEGDVIVAYEGDDKKYWGRLKEEFYDGRFVLGTEEKVLVCRECKHSIDAIASSERLCKRDDIDYTTCEYERSDKGKCGTEGIHYEPLPSVAEVDEERKSEVDVLKLALEEQMNSHLSIIKSISKSRAIGSIEYIKMYHIEQVDKIREVLGIDEQGYL